MFGVTVPLDLFRNPKVIEHAPGDTNWHKVTGYPPDNTNMTGFLITSIATTDASGSGFWIQMNVGTSAPSDQTKAWWVHGSGQVVQLGGGQNDLWVKLSVASDRVHLMYEA